MSTEEKNQAPSEPKRTKDHHLEEWTTGQRGGGKVPADFSWRSNPKQWQEEHGAAEPSRRLDG